jgi:acyl carrier protein
VEAIEDVVRQIIVERLELPIKPSEIDVNARLFGPASVGGLELDSLSSLELLTGLSDTYKLPLDDIATEDFKTVKTLADYLRRHGVDG